MEIETRYSRGAPGGGFAVERAASGRKLSGWAALWYDGTAGTQFELSPGVYERIAKTAFNDAVKRDDVRFLINHEPSLLLGRTTSGTLKLSVDKIGLFFYADLPQTQAADDVLALVERRDISQCSFQFIPLETRWYTDGDYDIRELVRVQLYDVSVVTYPAYTATSTSIPSNEPAQAKGRLSEIANARLAAIERDMLTTDPDGWVKMANADRAKRR